MQDAHETSRAVFDAETAHLSHYRRMANVISEERCYWMKNDESKLGVILEGKNKKFFGYVLLLKNSSGKFEFDDAKASFKTLEEAQEALIGRMQQNK